MPRKPAAKGKNETGHDAIVRRLLASRSAPVRADDPGAPSPEDLVAVARRFTADILPALTAFSGPSLAWRVEGARMAQWAEAETARIASPLTRNGGLVACIACDDGFLPAMMGALFGSVSKHERDPTASEMSVFAQLVVRLRDTMDPSLDHAPPAAPQEVMRLFSPADTAPVTVDLEIATAGHGGRLLVILSRGVAKPFLPAPPKAERTAPRMTGLPLKAQAHLSGPPLTLAEVADIAVGTMLPVAQDGRAVLTVGRREVAHGRLRDEGSARAIVISSNREPGHG